jgi:hypothetical protein
MFLSEEECIRFIRVIQRYANPASTLKTSTRTLIAALGCVKCAHRLGKAIEGPHR